MSKSPLDLDRIIARLRELIEACGPNKNDRVIAAITALIYEGVTSKRQIMSILRRIRFKTSHVAVTLKQLTGNNPAMNYWWEDADGRLHVHG
jgi:hypothetical protein